MNNLLESLINNKAESLFTDIVDILEESSIAKIKNDYNGTDHYLYIRKIQNKKKNFRERLFDRLVQWLNPFKENQLFQLLDKENYKIIFVNFDYPYNQISSRKSSFLINEDSTHYVHYIVTNELYKEILQRIEISFKACYNNFNNYTKNTYALPTTLELFVKLFPIWEQMFTIEEF